MNTIKAPFSLRSLRRGASAPAPRIDGPSAKVLGAAALLVASVGVAAAQEATQPLPAVRVDAPKEKPKPVVHAAPAAHHAAKPRRTTHVPAQQPAAPQAGAQGGQAAQAGAGGGAAPADANPYADPKAPYKVDRLSSNKFTEPVLNTPRTITVLTKEVLADKNATTLREIGRSTAGVTLGTGEGGNAFGDRFFIRGFDARNDIFVDGVRDPGVSIRENFYTEQVEILRGPGSSFSGRGTAGGAVNIVTKQAGEKDFYDLKFGGGPSDNSKRLTVDVNKSISPILDVRVNGVWQDSNVAGRNYVVDDRNGVSGSVVFKPTSDLKLTASYTHVRLDGLPDFGVPYNRAARRPLTEGVTSRNLYYGLVNRDFQRSQQDFGTFTGEYRVNEYVTLSSKLRQERSTLDYIGTLAESPNLTNLTVNLNPQSRYQVTNTLSNQTEASVKFDTGPVKHAIVVGTEFSREFVTRDSYTGLTSENSGVTFSGNGSLSGVSIFYPPNELAFSSQPRRAHNPTYIGVDSKAGYLIETANYQDLVILNGGVRYDDYNITSRSATTWAQNHSGMVNYNFGAVVKPLPNVSIFAAYATSSNPIGAELDGAAANYGGINAASQIFTPQMNKAWEVGAKWELFDRHLLATASYFQTNVSNAREVNSGVTTAGAAYEVNGVDLEVAGKINEKWSVTGGLVVMDSRVKSSYVPTNVGLQLANIAHESFSLLSKYEIGDLFGFAPDRLEIGGQAVYKSKVYGGNNLVANGSTVVNAFGLPTPTAANPYVNVPNVLPSAWRFDAFAEAKITENITFKVSVVNMFDRTYYDAFYQSATPFVQVAPGRTVLFEARAKF
ncbi:MAG TPA: TonB-dependent receptor [Methylosinus sp.]|jgi:catecholate siderophore receptor|uniref:TonB-dependent receptor n=1 Tax=Methylosinus sp. TaxID=427 RepID=UPI002F95FBE7